MIELVITNHKVCTYIDKIAHKSFSCFLVDSVPSIEHRMLEPLEL